MMESDIEHTGKKNIQ